MKMQTAAKYMKVILRLREKYGEIYPEGKMSHAARMLVESNMKVIEIAQKMGYLNSSKFSKVFTEAYGMTPTAYRKAHQRGQSGYGTRCAESH